MERAQTELTAPLPPVFLPSDQRGFTLIEVLVTGMIIASIVALSFFSLNVYMNEWEQGRLSNLDAIEAFRRRQLVDTALESVWEYIVTDPMAEREGKFYSYFSGTTQSAAFVTTSPVFGRSPIAAARIRLEPASDPDHTLLVYEEAPFDRFYLHYGDDPIVYARSIELPLTGTELRFRYFGLLEVKYLLEENRLEEINGWQESFDGRRKGATPQRIEIVSDRKKMPSPIYAFTVKATNRSKLAYYEFNF